MLVISLCATLIVFGLMYIINRHQLLGHVKNIVISGGSSGIGRALANICVRCGFNVVIIARNKERLIQVDKELKAFADTVKSSSSIWYIPLDLSKNSKEIKSTLDNFFHEKDIKNVDFVFNCAGGAHPGHFDSLGEECFQNQISINLFTAVNLTRVVLPMMKKERRGRLVFVSSIAGLLALHGYTAYSASKFALRGFADALSMETKPFNVGVTIAFPPDTETEGYATEMTLKNEECFAISKTAGVFSPERVAEGIFMDAMKGKYFSTVGMDGFFLSNLAVGMSRSSSVLSVIFQYMSLGILRLVGLAYLWHFDRIVKNIHSSREEEKYS